MAGEAVSTIYDLTKIDVTSGTALDGSLDDPTFRGFVTIRAHAANGDILLGQLDPGTIRTMALQFLEVAEAADQDRIVFTMLTRDIGIDAAGAAIFVEKMREERAVPDE